MKKVLITGGAGFIASHIADKLIEQGHKVVIIDNLSTGKKEINKNNDNFNKNSIFKYYIEGFNKETASNKIVSKLVDENLTPDNQNLFSNILRKSFIFLYIYKIKLKIKNLITKNKKTLNEKYQQHKVAFISENELTNIVKKLNKNSEFKFDIKVKPLFDSCYLITKNAHKNKQRKY
jgi:hypothetical protein